MQKEIKMKETENSGSGIFFDFLKVMATEKGRCKERKERGRYMRNYYTAVRNFFNAIYIGIGIENMCGKGKVESLKDIVEKCHEIERTQKSFCSFKKSLEKGTDIIGMIQEVFTEIAARDDLIQDLQDLKKCRDICVLAEQGKCEGKLRLRRRKGNQGADIGENLFDIQTVMLSLLGLFVLGYLVFIAVSADRNTVKERVGVEFTIDDVYATPGINENFSRYVCLIAPNGREVTVRDRELYRKLRNHVGQKVTLEVDRSYVLSKEGEKLNPNEKLVQPYVIRHIEGEIQKPAEKALDIEK